VKVPSLSEDLCLLGQKATRLSENALESTPVPVLFSLERKHPSLSENLCSLRRKATRLSENASERTLFCLRRARPGEICRVNFSVKFA